jgi:uncharacterized membrane protein YphA (DoxX/SURF4 family)
LTRFHFILAFVIIALIRITIGFHFFDEGLHKIAAGDFSAEPFFREATGPLAPYFKNWLDDPVGQWRFCLKRDPETKRLTLDPEITLAIWDDHLDRAVQHYRFSDKSIAEQLQKQLVEIDRIIEQAKKDKAAAGTLDILHDRRVQVEADIRACAAQLIRGEEILAVHSAELKNWLTANRTEVLAYFHSAERETGFARDGTARGQVATDVESLREQLQTIKQDRRKQMLAWANQVESIWDSYERQIQELAIGPQLALSPLKLHRPFAQPYSKLSWVNRLIPWFDVVVGVLLVIGLWTRWASLAGALFLAAVISTQLPWIPGSQSVLLYWLELLALMLMFATNAGRWGGVDYFFQPPRHAI